DDNAKKFRLHYRMELVKPFEGSRHRFDVKLAQCRRDHNVVGTGQRVDASGAHPRGTVEEHVIESLENLRHMESLLYKEARLLLGINEEARLSLELHKFQVFPGNHGPAISGVRHIEKQVLHPYPTIGVQQTICRPSFVAVIVNKLSGERHVAERALEIQIGEQDALVPQAEADSQVQG